MKVIFTHEEYDRKGMFNHQWRRVLSTGYDWDDALFAPGVWMEYSDDDGATWETSIYDSFYFMFRPKFWRLGYDNTYYDGDHHMISLGPLHLYWHT